MQSIKKAGEGRTTVWTYLKPYWLMVVLAPLFMAVEVWMDLLLPKIMAGIIDGAIPSGDIPLILRQGLLMIACSLIGLVGGLGCFYFSISASECHAAKLRSGLFSIIQSFSFHNLDRFKTGSLVTRLTNDVEQVKNALGMALRMMVRAPLLIVGSVVMAVQFSPGLSRVFLVSVPALVIVLMTFLSRAFPLFRVMRKKLDRVNVVMHENLAGIRVVKAFVRAEHEQARFDASNTDFRDTALKVTRIMSLVGPVFTFILNATIVAVLWIGGGRLNSGTMLTGELMAFIQYIGRLMMSLMMVSFFITMLASARAAVERINEVLQEKITIMDPPESRDWPRVTEGKVEFRGVSFRYGEGGGDAVLKDISFTAEPGQTVAILGATGSGKSTLVHLIPRLYDAAEGQILVDGTDVRDYRLHDLRGAMGVSLQQAVLLSRSVRDSISYGAADISQADMVSAAQDAQADGFINAMEHGYDSLIAQRGVNFSGGQKQRLAIARALAVKPKILIFDDSTSAVDVATEVRIREALKRRAKGTTTFLVAQRISSVMSADKILLLEDGRIAAQGTHPELMQSSSLYRDIYNSQLGGESGAGA